LEFVKGFSQISLRFFSPLRQAHLSSLDSYILSHFTPFVKNYFYYFLSTDPRVSRARAMSAMCGHHSLLDNLAILFDESDIAIVAPKFIFVVAIDEFILVQEFFATIRTNKVFDVHFVYLTFCKYYSTGLPICQALFFIGHHKFHTIQATNHFFVHLYEQATLLPFPWWKRKIHHHCNNILISK
jgi:hypothetical protein